MEQINVRTRLDDYLQLPPLLPAYMLDFVSVKGRHSLLERLVLLLVSNTFMSFTTNAVKGAVGRLRPDANGFYSFPSGHTATAFMSAEILRQEFIDHPWIGVAGYAMATATGLLRMVNNRHWLTDVLVGAGIGMMSVRLAYWM